MLLFEYLGYVLLYGYAVFGLFYLVSRHYGPLQYNKLDDYEINTPILLKTQHITELDIVFEEYDIRQIEHN